MAQSVSVSVEAPIENQILSIDYDETEKRIKKKSKQFNLRQIHLKNILNKLKEAYTEVTVLHDVLNIAKEKHYLVLYPVLIHEAIEVKPMAVVYARKKALGMAGNILISGAERLKRLDNGPDFQIELLRLRQNWRLKKVSDNIIGDLSFRTAGSKFMHPGNFEVSKADESEMKGPNPSTLSVTIPLLAGPHSYDRHELWEITKSQNQTLLEQIIAQAQHVFMRKRTQYVLDTLARDVKDPQITSHWNALNSPTLSWVKINITTHGYDTITRTSLVIHVKERSLKAICRDGRVMHMSYEPQELRDLILQQNCQHQISGLQNLSRCMAWQLLSNSNHLGIGDVEPLGNANSILISSPLGDRVIAVQVRCDPQIVVKVYVLHSPKEFFTSGPLVQGKHWENLGSEFKEVNFEKMEGRNFLNKMEFLMAALTKIKE
ncbi:hypothetical protein PVAND_012849 [Polypedilum vanderplanki]|uniref:Mediator of RNA polymerase II transcription subunit 17 n=1 Tax=Polypedilum vanderplanki TaxID=319348 RepID=A0A9J6CNP3_POLVA|nr:hypothetical protein PVAND_012849 [Polypedilum vanderplanki]